MLYYGYIFALIHPFVFPRVRNSFHLLYLVLIRICSEKQTNGFVFCFFHHGSEGPEY